NPIYLRLAHPRTNWRTLSANTARFLVLSIAVSIVLFIRGRYTPSGLVGLMLEALISPGICCAGGLIVIMAPIVAARIATTLVATDMQSGLFELIYISPLTNLEIV